MFRFEMSHAKTLRAAIAILAATTSPCVSAQDAVIGFEEALSLAQRNNGTISAARYALLLSESRARFDFGAFFPTVTPTYRYEKSRTEQNGLTFRTDEGFPGVSASWTLFDFGLRDLSYRSSRQTVHQSRAEAVQTIREVLFVVAQQYLNGLRAQEILRVQQASVERANELLKATDAQIAAKQAPAIDRLQANADLLNARVDFLTASNFYTTTLADLKALIGVDRPSSEIRLAEAPAASGIDLPTIEESVRAGLAAREDLKARRFGIEAQRLTHESAKREAGVSVTLDANYSRNWSDSELDNRALTLLASYPLFDGGQRREIVRQAALSLDSLKSAYRQAERDATAEIESAYLELKQNRERLSAANEALKAARENYAAASDAQRLGAEGTDVLSVLAAKISLVTAESNAVEAAFDVYISELRYRLATGQRMPGETI